jgi:phospholipid/cholesterol/gamma-HCH transport system substrate-binding protein
VNLDQLLASLDADTRSYLQELVDTAGPALDGRGTELSAVLRRLDPTTRDFELISHQLVDRRGHIARVVHNLAILTAAIGTRDTQLANLLAASNAALQTIAQENADVSNTVAQLPGALTGVRSSLGRLTTTARLANTALGTLRPTATALAPSLRASQTLFDKTRSSLGNQIGPFTHAAQPTVAELGAAARSLARATPNLTAAFSVLDTFLNELAYNPSSARPGYLFYLGWAAHDLDSILSTGDANGALLRAEFLFSPANVPVFCIAQKGTPPAAILVQQLALPQCAANGGG